MSTELNKPAEFSIKLLLKEFGYSLYSQPTLLLWEVIKNGFNANMLDPKIWDHNRAIVDVNLLDNHPLSLGKPCLLVFDPGSGFTEEKFKRFRRIGPDEEDSSLHTKGDFGGSSQKGIGKLGAFLLNREARKNYDAPIYIITRTTSSGDALFIQTSLARLRDGSSLLRTISMNDPALVSHRNFKGSFSLFIIPNSLITNTQEIIDDLQWRIPRIASKNVHLTINGKRLVPPPLAKNVYSFGGITAHVERCKDASAINAGIYLCDKESGLRCAHAPDLSKYLPYPMESRNVWGEVFIEGLLSMQNASRESIDLEHLKSDYWLHIVSLFRLHLVEHLNKLIGNLDDCDSNTRLGQNLNIFSTLCNNVWGEGDDVIGTPPIPPKPTTKDTDEKEKDPKPPKPNPPNPEPDPRPPVKKGKAVKIGDRHYFFTSEPRPSEPDVFGILDTIDESDEKNTLRRIRLNPHYAVLKRLKGHANFEHFLSRVLELVATSIDPGRPHIRHKTVSKLRLALLDHK